MRAQDLSLTNSQQMRQTIHFNVTCLMEKTNFVNLIIDDFNFFFF